MPAGTSVSVQAAWAPSSRPDPKKGSTTPWMGPGAPPAESMCSVAQPCLTLFDPMDCSPPGSSGRKKLSILISYVFTAKATSPRSTAVCLDLPHGTLTSHRHCENCCQKQTSALSPDLLGKIKCKIFLKIPLTSAFAVTCQHWILVCKRPPDLK